MPSFDMNTRPETFVPLIHCIIDDTFPKPRQTFVPSHFCQTLFLFIDFVNMMSVANVSVHASVTFNVTQEYTNN